MALDPTYAYSFASARRMMSPTSGE